VRLHLTNCIHPCSLPFHAAIHVPPRILAKRRGHTRGGVRSYSIGCAGAHRSSARCGRHLVSLNQFYGCGTHVRAWDDEGLAEAHDELDGREEEAGGGGGASPRAARRTA
jgi:hypothetical protein